MLGYLLGGGALLLYLLSNKRDMPGVVTPPGSVIPTTGNLPGVMPGAGVLNQCPPIQVADASMLASVSNGEPCMVLWLGGNVDDAAALSRSNDCVPVVVAPEAAGLDSGMYLVDMQAGAWAWHGSAADIAGREGLVLGVLQEACRQIRRAGGKPVSSTPVAGTLVQVQPGDIFLDMMRAAYPGIPPVDAAAAVSRVPYNFGLYGTARYKGGPSVTVDGRTGVVLSAFMPGNDDVGDAIAEGELAMRKVKWSRAENGAYRYNMPMSRSLGALMLPPVVNGRIASPKDVWPWVMLLRAGYPIEKWGTLPEEWRVS